METINIALEQNNSKNEMEAIFAKHDFFTEYFQVFNDSDKFTENTLESLSKISRQEIEDISAELEEMVQKKLSRIKQDTGLKVEPGMVIFVGDGSWDGHGILVKGRPYVYFDLTAIKRAEGQYNMEIYVTHELLHALHYGERAEFYPGNYTTSQDRYLKRLVTEGLATYMGDNYSFFEIDESYWLGILSPEEVAAWIDNCEENRIALGEQLQTLVEEDEFDLDLFYQLFAITSQEYVENRYGYYYGTKIIEKARVDNTTAELLQMEYAEYEECISSYFDW